MFCPGQLARNQRIPVQRFIHDVVLVLPHGVVRRVNPGVARLKIEPCQTLHFARIRNTVSLKICTALISSDAVHFSNRCKQMIIVVLIIQIYNIINVKSERRFRTVPFRFGPALLGRRRRGFRTSPGVEERFLTQFRLLHLALCSLNTLCYPCLAATAKQVTQHEQLIRIPRHLVLASQCINEVDWERVSSSSRQSRYWMVGGGGGPLTAFQSTNKSIG